MKKLLLLVVVLLGSNCLYCQIAKIQVADSIIIIEDGSLIFRNVGDTVNVSYDTHTMWKLDKTSTITGTIERIALPNESAGAKVMLLDDKTSKVVETYHVGLYDVGDIIRIIKPKTDADDGYGWRVGFDFLFPKMGEVMVEYAVIKKKFK